MNRRPTAAAMYQLEVKRYLVEHRFPPRDGWRVTADVDGMERGKGRQQSPEKRRRAETAEETLVAQGVQIGAHSKYGRADLVASKTGEPTFIFEVEGDARKQKEQAMYSALGQTVLLMESESGVRYGLAVPDTPDWESQMLKIPRYVCERLTLTLWLVSKERARELT